MTYCSICGEYLGFYENEEIHTKCNKLKKIISLYGIERVFDVCDSILIRNETQVERKKNLYKTGKISNIPLPPLKEF